MKHPFIHYNRDFTLFGMQHLLLLALLLFLAICLPMLAKKWLSAAQQLSLSRGLAVVISSWVILYTVIKLWIGDFDPTQDLPFDICNALALALPWLMWKPTQRVHEVLYFWILAGTLQGILTPHLMNGFPNFIFFKYWFVHGGLVVYIIYATVVFELKPTLRSIWRAFLALQVYVLIVLGLNVLLGANYVYLLHKPPTASLLDYLGPWPWYLVVVELIALLLFVLVYLPVNGNYQTKKK